MRRTPRTLRVDVQIKGPLGWRFDHSVSVTNRAALRNHLLSVAKKNRKPARAVRPRIKKNPDTAHENKVREAARLLKKFSGHTAKKVIRLTRFKQPDTVLAIGRLRAVIYDTVRDGKAETYIHRFRQSSRPLFAASHDGKQLFMLGGAYNFTERGIVDKT